MQAKGKKGKKGKQPAVASRNGASRQGAAVTHQPATNEDISKQAANQFTAANKRVSFDNQKELFQQTTVMSPRSEQANLDPGVTSTTTNAKNFAGTQQPAGQITNMTPKKIMSPQIVPDPSQTVPNTSYTRNKSIQKSNLAKAPFTATKPQVPGSMYCPSQRQNSYDNEDQSQSLGSTRPLWREKYDKNQVYSLDQTFKMSCPHTEHRREISRWNNADIKGRRQTAFIKQVQSKNASIMTVVPQTRLERAHKYTDGHKCLNFRKKMIKFRIQVSEGANTITSSKYFEGFIILIIGLNCITLAGSDSTKEETPAEKNIDLIFNVIYTCEMFLRIFSLGFIWAKGSYLRSMWCQLDFICVTTALSEYVIGGGGSLGALRAFRVLRPLRFVNNIQGLKSIVQSIMAAIPMLKNTLVVLFFFFLIFAIGGLNLFMGLLKLRCIHEMTGDTLINDQGDEVLCGSTVCPLEYYCGKTTLNPNSDVTNFDNIFWALLNVFQCVTMEGWSEIMVMYQRAYTPLVIFFFVPLVFIGAFFLLNLNLAVIQTKYSETQADQKEKKEKDARDLEQLTQAAASSSNKENQEDEDGGGPPRLGVAEYYIAKRAAKKLKAFWNNYKNKQEQAEKKNLQKVKDDLKTQQDQEVNELKRRLTRRKKSIQMNNTLSSGIPLKRGTSIRSKRSSDNVKNEGVSLQDFTVGGDEGEEREDTQELEDQVSKQFKDEEDKQNKLKNPPSNSSIREDDEESYEQRVEEFLKDLNNNDTNEAQTKKPDPQFSVKARTINHQALKQSAYNDVRISGTSRANNFFTTIDRNQRPKNEPQKNNFTVSKEKGQIFNDLDEEDLGNDHMHDKILRELDFDKVVVQREFADGHMTDPATKHDYQDKQGGNNDNMSDMDHPLDMSFTKDINQGKRASGAGYASENNMQSESSDDGISLSLSDESIARKINELDEQNAIEDESPFDRTDEKNLKNSRFQRKQTKIHQSKEINQTFKRMLTVGFKKEKDDKNMNETQSTFLGNQPSVKHQIDIFSNFHNGKDAKKIKKQISEAEKEKDSRQLQVGGPQTAVLRDQNNSKLNEQVKIKHDKQNLIAEIDKNYFTTEKPQDPIEFINAMTEKSAINPGVTYESTSQKEIFEIRNKLRQKEYLSSKNPFIAPPEDENDVGLYEGKQEESYIHVRFEAYQLKTLYRVKDVEEVDIGSDDEDAVVLQPQPYETTMSIGFKDYLNHLTTKFIARRSDIIVSSTLSITLTPNQNTVEPTHFALIDGDEIWDYIMGRQEYRASQVISNKLLKATERVLDQSVESSVLFSKNKDEEEESEVVSEYDEDRYDSVKFGEEGKPHYLLDPTIESKKLDKYKVNQLGDKQRKLYDIQKNKFDQKKQKLKNRKKASLQLPKEYVFNLEEASLLIKGQFKFEDEEDEPEMEDVKVDNGELNLGRAMLNGAPNDPQHEMNLEGFDIRLVQALWDKDSSQSLHDPRMNEDHVPQEMKDAFNLPQDMSSYDIDFNAVRNMDAQFSKRWPIWSGQEVLEIGLTKDSSSWILKKMALLRVWPKGFYNLVKKCRSLIKDFCRLSLFGGFLTSCVLINTIGMAMESYDITDETKADLEFQNTIFTWIFIVEMTLKLLAFGPTKYSKEVMNLLDGGVVILSIVELLMSALGGGSGAGSLQAFRTIRVFRTFRVLRVTRLLRGLQSMAMVIRVIGKSFMDFILITILMFVFIFIYTLLGRQIFQGQYEFGPDAELPRANFESFSVAFVTVFQVLTMENWQQVLYASMQASDNNMLFKTVTSIYYISWIFIGNFILLNLFLAILIDAFNEEEDIDEDEASDEEKEQKKRKVQNAIRMQKEKRMKKLGTTIHQLRANTTLQQNDKPQVKKKIKMQRSSFTGKGGLREEDLENIEDMTAQEIRTLLVHQGLLKATKSDNIDPKTVGPEIEADKSLYLFHRDTCFRRNIHFIQKHKNFENFVMLLIGLSSVKLASESYFVNEPETSMILTVSNDLDTTFNHCFNLECVLKVLALGFAMDEGSYLRDSWNKLDFFIVVTSNIDMALANTDIPALKVLRMLRMIRPLRVISHNPQLKMIVAALAKSVAPISNVAIIVMIIWLMFAIYGMNTYMGSFFYCSEMPYKYNTQWVCEDHGAQWKRFDSNFDDIGQSMITLFIIASLEGWPDIMYQALDVTKRDNGPKLVNSPMQSVFFIVFILIGSFFFLNFFIGVLFLEYEKAERNHKKGFTPEMLYWKELSNLIVNAKVPHELRYKPQDQGIQLTMYKLVVSDPFELGIMTCIVLNMFQMALDHEGASPGMINFLKVTNYIFTTIFLLECIIKLYVYRRPYFKTGWNKFDFFVVGSSIIDLGLEFALPTPEGGQDDGGSEILSVGPQLARVLRVLRVSRILRLAGKAQELQGLLKTIMMSVESLFNVFILLMLIFFISAVLGNTMFYEVKEGDVIDEFKNFTNFHQSFALLFSISTGEDWNRIMFDCMRLPPDCIPGLTCGSSIAPVFFLTFIMVVTNVMLNLFILVIIQNFTKYYLEPDNPLSCFEWASEDFIAAWQNYTSRYQCMKIKPKHVPAFLNELSQPMKIKLDIKEGTSEDQISKIVLKMKLAVTDDGFIFFNEMLYRLMHYQYVIHINLKLNRAMTVEELITQYKIAEITYQNQQEKKLTKQEAEDVFMTQMNTAPVNLFLTKMFYRTSFMTWHKQVKIFLDKKKHETKQAYMKERCEQMGEEFVSQEFIGDKAVPLTVECEYEVEKFYILSDGEEKEYIDDTDKQTVKSFTIKNTNHSIVDNAVSPEQYRMFARGRMQSNDKKYPKFMGEECVHSEHGNSGNQSSIKPKKMMIAHTLEESNRMAHHEFVDPNSTMYQNVVMECKINKHEKAKSRRQPIQFDQMPWASSISDSKYEGKYSPRKDESMQSPTRINDPMHSQRKDVRKKKVQTFSK